MVTIRRGDLCPCGSGKKYARCCLVKEQETPSRQRDEMTAAPRALQWLGERYPEAIRDVVRDEFYGDLDDGEMAALGKLPPKLQEMLIINMHEWLIADASIMIKGVRKPVREILLEPGGPLFSAGGRDWLERLVERRLSLYEVRGVTRAEGLQLSDLLQSDEPSVWVQEKAASQALVRWDVVGTRIVRQGPGWVLSGAAYPFIREETQDCREEIIGKMTGEDWNSDRARDLVGTTMISYWLRSILAERPLPQILDSSTKEPIMLVTEHYQVTDWDALSGSLALQPDVEGDRRSGWGWFAEEKGEVRRARAALNVREPDGLEIFCRTLKLANEARTWFEGIAGAAVRYKVRGIVDPRSPKALASASTAAPPDMPAGVQMRLMREVLFRHYDDWTEKPIPALGNKSPRQAVKTKAGRQAVIELLKTYEVHEAHRNRDQGSEPFDFGFLWERLGLKRET